MDMKMKKHPPIDIDDNTNHAEENLSDYDINPMHLMPHWQHYNFDYTKDTKNDFKKD